ncbi:aminoacetone oxidase family FAD-binding enzyme [Patescibacteria group bacterium]
MKIAIIGGGAAGMMAAATIAESNLKNSIIILEKNDSLGRKVSLSGGGRCNLTTTITDLSTLVDNYPRGNKWIKYALHNFNPKKCRQWFESHNIPLKVEKNKVFPKSDNSKDIIDMFIRVFKKNNVKINYRKSVEKIGISENKFKLLINDGTNIRADKVVIATGGRIYNSKEDTVDGYNLAENLGHKVTKLAKSLSSFITNNKIVHKLAGLSFGNVKMKLIGLNSYKISGPLLFTHIGVSGPGIFSLSSLSAFEKCDESNKLQLFIDFLPELGYKELTKKIEKLIKENPKSKSTNTFVKLVPKSIIEVILNILKIDISIKNSELSKKNINRIVENLKNFELQIIGRTPGSEIVTAGGVDLNEVKSKTMESKIVPGLFFAGEILDVDGFTGGFNLQNAWATGRLAGENIT